MFRLATFNVNSIRSRLHIVIPWLKENNPDVLCMQETKVEDRKFPESDFHRIGYHVVFRGGKGRNGVAVASKMEPENVSFGLDTDPRDEDRLIRVEIDGIVVVNTYVPQGYRVDDPRYQYKLEWLRRLKGYFERNVDLNGDVVWCGDMNVAPEDIDVHSPKKLRNHVCFHEEVRKLYRSVRDSLGFVDLFRKHHPDEIAYSFFDYRVKSAVERGLGWRVDHILATKSLSEKSLDCYIDMKPRLMKKPSDHTVVVAEFDL
jgi:exodeoxyribonuclease-3